MFKFRLIVSFLICTVVFAATMRNSDVVRMVR